MDIDDLILYFYIACGVIAALFLILLILICRLHVKIDALASDGSNRLGSQTSVMSDFCYTNPYIVPGEELSKRGYSMYQGTKNKMRTGMHESKTDYPVYLEERSNF